MADSSQSAPMLDTDDELAALQALASELAAEAEDQVGTQAAEVQEVLKQDLHL